MNRIAVNESMVAFSANNIGYVQHKHLIGLRIEGLLLRTRFVVYQLILVSMNQMAIPAALLIFTLELTHLVTYTYYSARYRYAKNWLLFLSKFNIGFAILIICAIALYISVMNLNTRGSAYTVNKYIQYAGILFFMVCILGELFLLILNVIFSIYVAIRNWRRIEKKPKVALLKFHWERIDYIPTPEELELRNKHKKPKKGAFDEYIGKNIVPVHKTQVLEGDNMKKFRRVDSDHEDLKGMSQHDDNMQGGVEDTEDVRNKFTNMDIKTWTGYANRYGLARCNVPVEISIKESLEKGTSMAPKKKAKKVKGSSFPQPSDAFLQRLLQAENGRKEDLDLG